MLIVLESQYGYYVPPKCMVSMRYLKQILKKDKVLLRKADVTPISRIEKYHTLTTKKLYGWAVSNIPNLLKYLPDDKNPCQ